ncbi:hypothetical protein CPC08DRAFT_649853 [Agrocybe pediades]|nr:hypothetical protein CPC08DRAFT_649853 [Agrocybe pediades]
MLTFALEYRTAIDKFTADRKNDIRDLEMVESEWEIVQELNDVLMVLKHATTYFSRADSTLADVIPVMDIVNDRLTAHANDDSLSPAIRAALGLAKKTLNRYYSRTDDTPTYRIAMILHPKYKMDYFRDAKWEQSWMDV